MGHIEPLVSVVSITYNHERFISKMIEGVLMQQTSFPIELIVAEDCSTDLTRDIILEYQNRYPELIRVIMSESNIGAVANEKRAILAAKGKYIAFCEGDDYWTDPFKLQKQIDFLEFNSNYSVCFHRCRHFIYETKEWKEDNCGQFFHNGLINEIEVTTEMFFKQWITQPLTMILRKNALDLSFYDNYQYYRDIHQIYHLLKIGKGYLFAFEGGVRIVHKEGMASLKSLLENCETTLSISKELFEKNHSIETKQYYEDILQWCIHEFSGRLKNKLKALALTFNLLQLQKDFRKFGANVKRIF